jgi:hypothetical protein
MLRRRRLLNFLTALSLLLCVAACVLWARSLFVGDYFVLRDGDFDGCHISIARGDVRLARGSWRGPNGERMFSCPIERIGEYSAIKSIYVPLWTFVIATGTMGVVFWRRSHGQRVPGHCRSCGFDVRATPGRRPECGPERPAVVPSKPEPRAS